MALRSAPFRKVLLSLFVLLGGTGAASASSAQVELENAPVHAPRSGAPHAQASGHGVVTHGEAAGEAPQIPQGRPALVAGELRTERFVILYTARSEGSAKALAERVEATRNAFRETFGREWPGTTEIRLAMGREEMEALTLAGSRVPRWAEALAWPRHNVILVDALSLLKPSGEVTLRHELSHVALGQLSHEWPRWFQEGVAMYLTGDRFSVTQYSAMFRAVTQGRLFDFSDLSHAWPDHPSDVEVAYAQSVTFVAHLTQRYGRERLGELVDHVQGGASFEVAFARSFLTSLGVEQESWAKGLPALYSWTPILTSSTVVLSVGALVLVAGWVRRRRVKAEKLAMMSAQEAAEDAARRLSETLPLLPPAGDGTSRSGPGAEDPSWIYEDHARSGGGEGPPQFDDSPDDAYGHRHGSGGHGDDEADGIDRLDDGLDGFDEAGEDDDTDPGSPDDPRPRRVLH